MSHPTTNEQRAKDARASIYNHQLRCSGNREKWNSNVESIILDALNAATEELEKAEDNYKRLLKALGYLAGIRHWIRPTRKALAKRVRKVAQFALKGQFDVDAIKLLSSDLEIKYNALNAATKEKNTRIAELNDALKPFVVWADKIGTLLKDDGIICTLEDHSGETALRAGHFRRAAAVIEEG